MPPVNEHERARTNLSIRHVPFTSKSPTSALDGFATVLPACGCPHLHLDNPRP